MILRKIVDMVLITNGHGRLQSCVGTRARLGYAAFDAQLRKAYFVFYNPYVLCACIIISTLMLYRGSLHPVPVI